MRNRFMLIGAFATTSLSASLFAQVGDPIPGPSRPCYQSVTKSCVVKHANTGRTCFSVDGTALVDCGDLIIYHGSYGDVYTDAVGLMNVDPNCGWGTPAEVRKFVCSQSGNSNVFCNDTGVHILDCKNRCPTGGDCDASTQ